MSKPHARYLWRISNYADLSGTGGLESPGRWHPAGSRIVYFADSSASVILEVLVHLEVSEDIVPEHFNLLKVEVPADCTVTEVAVPDGDEWKSDLELTRSLGSNWLRSMASPLASVPSAIAPEGRNFLLNPLHPDASRVRIISERQERFDPRLFRIGGH